MLCTYLGTLHINPGTPLEFLHTALLTVRVYW